MSNFREKLLQCKGPSDIADLALKEATKPTDFATVTVPVPAIPGAKLSYKVMKGYISSDNYPIPVDAVTADALAKRWGLHLPTGKMVDQITQEAAKSGGVIKVQPLSGSGVKDLGLSPEDISQRHIADPRVIDKHNDLVQQYIKEKGISADSIIIGDQKVLIAPEPGKEGRTHFKGFVKSITEGPDGKPRFEFFQKGTTASPHPSQGHFEYPLKAKLVDDKMTLTLPNGDEKSLSFAQAMRIPELSSALSGSKVSTYSAAKGKSDKKEDKYDYSSKGKETIDSLGKSSDKPSTSPDASKSTWDKIKETASEAWKSTKSFLGDIFAQAEEFELTAIAELRKTEIKKIAARKKINKRRLVKK